MVAPEYLVLALAGMAAAWLLQVLGARLDRASDAGPDLTSILQVLGVAAVGFGAGRLWGPTLWAHLQGVLQEVPL